MDIIDDWSNAVKTPSLTFLLLVVLVEALLGACQPAEGLPGSPAPVASPDSLAAVDLPAGFGARNDWIEVYFTDPESPLASQETGGVDELLVTAIDSARLTVDLAIYSFSLRNVRDALVRAHARGVAVRVVAESDNLDGYVFQDLVAAGVPVLGDRREGLMHDKFMVVDRREVWLGSMNYTYSGAYEDNNVLLRVRSAELVDNYTREFDEMFVEDRFGPLTVPDTPHPAFEVGGVRLESMFSPDDGVADRLSSLLRGAQRSIRFMAFSFTSDELGAAIRARAEGGIQVAGVMDAEQIEFNLGTEYDLFQQAGLDVYLDGLDGQLHHKVIIVDGRTVIVGSYNFTRSAETRNDENVLIIHDIEIAGVFLEEFARVYARAGR